MDALDDEVIHVVTDDPASYDLAWHVGRGQGGGARHGVVVIASVVVVIIIAAVVVVVVHQWDPVTIPLVVAEVATRRSAFHFQKENVSHAEDSRAGGGWVRVAVRYAVMPPASRGLVVVLWLLPERPASTGHD
jgi:hypothetical protein